MKVTYNDIKRDMLDNCKLRVRQFLGNKVEFDIETIVKQEIEHFQYFYKIPFTTEYMVEDLTKQMQNYLSYVK